MNNLKSLLESNTEWVLFRKQKEELERCSRKNELLEGLVYWIDGVQDAIEKDLPGVNVWGYAPEFDATETVPGYLPVLVPADDDDFVACNHCVLKGTAACVNAPCVSYDRRDGLSVYFVKDGEVKGPVYVVLMKNLILAKGTKSECESALTLLEKAGGKDGVMYKLEEVK